MKTILILAALLVVGVIGMNLINNNEQSDGESVENSATTTPGVENATTTATTSVRVTPIEHASLVLTMGDVIVYVDPVGGPELFANQPPADVVLITDIHGDHLSTTTLERVVGAQTTLIAPAAVKELLPEALAGRVKVMANNQTATEQGISIAALPMYNFPESDESRHTKGRGNGYVLSQNDSRVYIAGDTGPIPEMRTLTNIDMAFIPMNLPFTMSVEDAAEAVLAFAPATVYPYHYREANGLADVENFKTLVEAGNPAIEVELLEWYKE